MTNDYDGLKQSSGGDIRPMAELLGQTFTLVDFEDIETRFKDERTGLNRCTHIARVILDGEEEEVRYWMGGVIVNRNLAWIKTTGRLPFRVKLGGKGNQEAPYELVEPETPQWDASHPPKLAKPVAEKIKPKVDRPKTFKDRIADPLACFRKDGKLDSKAFVQWWEEEGGLTSNDLASVIGQPTMTALEAWFAADATRTVQGLVDEASGTAVDEALPFEEPE